MESTIELPRRKIAVLSYIFLAGSGYYFLDKYRTDKFIRFHAYQSIVITFLIIVVDVLSFFVIPLIRIPDWLQIYVVLIVGFVITLILYLWIRSVLSAWKGKKFLLPLFGGIVQFLVDSERKLEKEKR